MFKFSKDDPNLPQDNLMLQSPFEEQEIWSSVLECAGDKAPGPEWIHNGFFQTLLEVVNTEVIPTIQNFHERDKFQCYICCVDSKKVRAKELKIFRHISLIGSIYKII